MKYDNEAVDLINEWKGKTKGATSDSRYMNMIELMINHAGEELFEEYQASNKMLLQPMHDKFLIDLVNERRGLCSMYNVIYGKDYMDMISSMSYHAGEEEFLAYSASPKTPLQPQLVFVVEPNSNSPWDKQHGGAHYKSLTIQPLQYTLGAMGYEAFKGACHNHIARYTTRKKDNEVEQLKKARHILDLWIYEAEQHANGDIK